MSEQKFELPARADEALTSMLSASHNADSRSSKSSSSESNSNNSSNSSSSQLGASKQLQGSAAASMPKQASQEEAGPTKTEEAFLARQAAATAVAAAAAATAAAAAEAEALEGAPDKGEANAALEGTQWNSLLCKHFLFGRCARKRCRFLHADCGGQEAAAGVAAASAAAAAAATASAGAAAQSPLVLRPHEAAQQQRQQPGHPDAAKPSPLQGASCSGSRSPEEASAGSNASSSTRQQQQQQRQQRQHQRQNRQQQRAQQQQQQQQQHQSFRGRGAVLLSGFNSKAQLQPSAAGALHARLPPPGPLCVYPEGSLYPASAGAAEAAGGTPPGAAAAAASIAGGQQQQWFPSASWPGFVKPGFQVAGSSSAATAAATTAATAGAALWGPRGGPQNARLVDGAPLGRSCAGGLLRPGPSSSAAATAASGAAAVCPAEAGASIGGGPGASIGGGPPGPLLRDLRGVKAAESLADRFQVPFVCVYFPSCGYLIHFTGPRDSIAAAAAAADGRGHPLQQQPAPALPAKGRSGNLQDFGTPLRGPDAAAADGSSAAATAAAVFQLVSKSTSEQLLLLQQQQQQQQQQQRGEAARNPAAALPSYAPRLQQQQQQQQLQWLLLQEQLHALQMPAFKGGPPGAPAAAAAFGPLLGSTCCSEDLHGEPTTAATEGDEEISNAQVTPGCSNSSSSNGSCEAQRMHEGQGLAAAPPSKEQHQAELVRKSDQPLQQQQQQQQKVWGGTVLGPPQGSWAHVVHAAPQQQQQQQQEQPFWLPTLDGDAGAWQAAECSGGEGRPAVPAAAAEAASVAASSSSSGASKLNGSKRDLFVVFQDRRHATATAASSPRDMGELAQLSPTAALIAAIWGADDPAPQAVAVSK
ncbi:hypothetical protein Efla_001949 [Eimeria flavescens]